MSGVFNDTCGRRQGVFLPGQVVFVECAEGLRPYQLVAVQVNALQQLAMCQLEVYGKGECTEIVWETCYIFGRWRFSCGAISTNCSISTA